MNIPLSTPDMTQAERDAVAGAFDSGYVAPLGPQVDAFEAEFAAFTGRAHAVALASGTAALHLALLGCGIGPGDVVLTSTFTFAATANAIVYTGARPVFVDSGADGNIDVELAGAALADLQRRGTPAKAILPVDLLGKMCDPDPLLALGEQYEIPVIWDAAESVGATRSGRRAGSVGRAAALSFNGNKIMTTSGGGMLLTDDAELAKHTKFLATQAREPVAHYEHRTIGYNYRLSNLLAAVGRAQLSRLPEMRARRQAIRQYYAAFFAGYDEISMFGGPWRYDDGSADNCWLSAITIDKNAPFDRNDVAEALAAEGIESRPLWKPMHLQPVFANERAYVNGNSERDFQTGLSLPSGSVTTDAQLAHITNVLERFFASCARPAS